MIKKLIRKILGSKNKGGRDTNTPVVLGPDAHGIDPRLLSSNAVRVTSTLQEAGYEAFVVGGAVRDLLLGVKPKDFDIATNATPEQVRKLFRRAFIIGKRFQIVHVMFGQDLLEVTTFRGTTSDSAPKDEHGRVLRDNTFGSQAEDAVRRDFTINAMYYNPANEQVLDYHGGIDDIRARTLRIIGQPEARYREDPVRMLRVARIAAGKTVSPGFLFASLLWHQVLEKWTAYRAAGEQPIPALHFAADDVLDSQTEKLALQRKIGTDMRDIWSMQPRFERRNGKSPHKLLEHPRFRAGYDFLLLRCASGEIDAELGEWWTAFYEGDEIAREELLVSANRSPEAGTKKKRAPRRSTRSKSAAGAVEGGGGADGGGE